MVPSPCHDSGWPGVALDTLSQDQGSPLAASNQSQILVRGFQALPTHELDGSPPVVDPTAVPFHVRGSNGHAVFWRLGSLLACVLEPLPMRCGPPSLFVHQHCASLWLPIH